MRLLFTFSFFYCNEDTRDLHSFPTRRSSDLLHQGADGRHRRDFRRRTLGALLLPRLLGRRFRDAGRAVRDRKSTRLNSSHPSTSYAVFCLKKKIHPFPLIHTPTLLLLSSPNA